MRSVSHQGPKLERRKTVCRLYAMRANEPTRVECSLVLAQNALMQQSQMDAEGIVHGHGWGVADYRDTVPLVEKQTWAAYHGEHFRKTAARVYAHTVVAHVRHATVGAQAIENTHPFNHGRWIFAHNGSIQNFPQVRDLMIEHIDPVLRNDIKGETDSEHIFYYLLTLHLRHPDRPLNETVGRGLRRVMQWSDQVDPSEPAALNIVLTDGERLVGSRRGRTLWHLVRNEIVTCGICGRKHVRHDVGDNYRAIEIASEPISGENWQPFAEGVVYSIDENFHFHIEPLPETAGLEPA
nr:class II glutamine amidotransferase [Oricola nitratireducens]